MKAGLLTMVQLLIFIGVFFLGSIKPPFGMIHVIAVTREGTHAYYWDGVILMTVLFVVILLIEIARKQIRTSAGWTVFAFALAMAVAVKTNFLAFTR